jgi:Tfp pilus assembly pilus retraction ATPase PilT
MVDYVPPDVDCSAQLPGASHVLHPCLTEPACCTDRGRVAALEILVNTSAVANLIRQGKIDQLETSMQSGAAVGMQTMDNALKALVRKKRISGLEAYLQANNKSMFQDYKEEAELGNA